MHIHFTITSDMKEERWQQLLEILKGEVALAAAHQEKMRSTNERIAEGIGHLIEKVGMRDGAI